MSKKQGYVPNWADSIDDQDYDAWDDMNDIGDNELNEYIGRARRDYEEQNSQAGWPGSQSNKLYSSILGKMIDVNTGEPVEEEEQ